MSFTKSHQMLKAAEPEATNFYHAHTYDEAFKPVVPGNLQRAGNPPSEIPPKTQSHWHAEAKEHWDTNVKVKPQNAGLRAFGSAQCNEALWPEACGTQKAPESPRAAWIAKRVKVVPNRKKHRVARGKVGVSSPSSTIKDTIAFLATRTERLSAAYRKLDDNKDGAIDEGELHKLTSMVDPSITPEQNKAVFNMIDSSGDGRIDFVEFVEKLSEHDYASGTKHIHRTPMARSSSVVEHAAKERNDMKLPTKTELGPRTSAPSLQHGRGDKADVFDDGMLRSTIEHLRTGAPKKQWYDNRNWSKVRPCHTVTRLGADHHNAHAATSTLHGHYHNTLGLTQPEPGTPWYASTTSEWKRGCKEHKDISTACTLRQQDALYKARLAHMWERSQAVERRFKEQHNECLRKYDDKVALTKDKMAAYAKEIAIRTAAEDHRLSLGGKKKSMPPVAIGANGYQTFKCTNPGGGEEYYPKRSASSLW